jgi:NAD(P)H-hydrate repair Nnr-like enzyme with NAD(P)H-hydrate dehydratase domain
MQRTIVLTPNAVELKRLKQAIDECSEGEEKLRIQQSYRGVIVVQKGRYDTIFFASSLFHNNTTTTPPEEYADDKTTSLVCKEQGGLKGSIGTFLAWDRLLTETKSTTTATATATTTQDPSTTTMTSQAMLPLPQHRIEQQRLVPCWLACCIVKRATKVAYDKKRRAMTAPNVLNEIGTVVDETITSAFDRL